MPIFDLLGMVSLQQSSAPKTTKRARVVTLGCRLNQSESLLIQDKLIKAGYEIVKGDEPSDLNIINTCTVTDRADSKCRSSIRQLIRKDPNAITVVAGCYSQMGYKEVAQIPGVDVIVGNQQKMNLLDFVDGQKNERPLIVRDKIDKEDFSIHFVGEHLYNKRANLKIQDGCDFFCSFCIIPHARGRARSRDFDNCMDEARALADRGVRELVITGVNIGTFASQGRGVLEVVDALNEIPGIERVRISSIEPTTIPTELFSRMNDSSHALMPFLHIPLQAGCDKTLEAMYRKYTIGEYLDFLHLAYESVNDVYLGTDIMVGFPGETRDDFEETCQVLLNNPFHFAHVFTYSARKGTPAKRREDHIDQLEKNRRSLHLRRLSEKKRYDFYESWLGKTVEVLIEDPKPALWTGLTPNYIRVCIPRKPSDPDYTNQKVRVLLKSVAADFVEGEIA